MPIAISERDHTQTDSELNVTTSSLQAVGNQKVPKTLFQADMDLMQLLDRELCNSNAAGSENISTVFLDSENNSGSMEGHPRCSSTENFSESNSFSSFGKHNSIDDFLQNFPFEPPRKLLHSTKKNWFY